MPAVPALDEIDQAVLDCLVCPEDLGRLAVDGSELTCAGGHRFPVVDGVPVMLSGDALARTMALVERSRARAAEAGEPPLYLEAYGISPEVRAALLARADETGWAVDPAVSWLVETTCGRMYSHLVGRLPAYPAPELRLPDGGGGRLLDVGCGWGRWSMAASRRGYQAVGVDPSIAAVMAARRVSRAAGLPARFVVGDARCLPVADASFDAVFSYSVIQHMSREDARTTAGEIARVLRPGGEALVQMPTVFGVRCLYHQARRAFREPGGRDVRYWTIPALRRLFAAIGPARVEADCYFGIGLQAADAHLMTPLGRLILRASGALRRLSGWCAPLLYAADSVYLRAVRRQGSPYP